MKTSHKNLLAAFSLLLSLVPQPSLANEGLVFATREHTLTNRFVESVLTEAYARLQIEITFTAFPGARSIIEANAGRADGEVARLKAVLKRYRQLILVPVPILHSELSAFTHKGYALPHSNWNSLRGHSVTTIRGFNFVKQKLARGLTKTVRTSREAIDLIENDLVEVAVLNAFLGRLAIAASASKNVMEQKPPLERLPVFHLLHSRHAPLVPRITAVLQKMETNGTIKNMWRKFELRELTKATTENAR